MAPFANLFHPAHPAIDHPPISPPLHGHPFHAQPQLQDLQPHPQPQVPPQFHFPALHLHTHLTNAGPLPRPRPHPHHHEVHAPDFDVCESERAYYLEGEFPGISDRRAIKLAWVDRRTLAIEARVGRVDLGGEWGVEGDVKAGQEGVDVENGGEGEVDGGPCVREAEVERWKREEVERERERERERVTGKRWPGVREWLAERRVGQYQRTFTFPADVDAGGVRARLGQGLLRVMVPKDREAGGRATTQVDVEDVEEA